MKVRLIRALVNLTRSIITVSCDSYTRIKITPWRKDIWKVNITVIWSRNYPPFMEPQGSSPCLQEPATTDPCSELDEYNPHTLNPIFLICTLILSFHLHIDLLCALFTSDFLTKILYTFFIHSHTLHDPLILSALILLLNIW